jgi:putative (di)nucleoside polyphosphate hydrolase
MQFCCLYQGFWFSILNMYRSCVLIVVFDPVKKLFLSCKRPKIDAWQFPQGGIETDESVEEGAKKELFEETGLILEKIEKIVGPYKYDFPKATQLKRSLLGQDQFWVLTYKGSDAKINLNYEFDDHKWADLKTVLDEIVDFKKEVYVKALGELEDCFKLSQLP